MFLDILCQKITCALNIRYYVKQNIKSDALKCEIMK